MSGRPRCSARSVLSIFVLLWGAILAPVCNAHADQEVSAEAALKEIYVSQLFAYAGEFETPGTLDAQDLLPDYLCAGDLFSVDPKVHNDGETNHYVIRSPLGDAEAAGRDELEQAIQEIRALDLLKASSKRTGAAVGFNEGMKSLATSPYRAVKRVVFNPLYAVKAVPTEIIDYAGKIASVHDLVTDGPVVFVRRSVGIDGARNDLAKRLRVDNDTENEALREEIKRVGWGVWLGGIAPEISDGYADLSLDLSKEVGDLGDGNLGRAVDAIRREALPRSARRLLKKLKISRELSKAFRNNPHYEGRMRENLVSALLAMPDTEGRSEYVAWANLVKSPGEARRAMRLAQVMAVSNAAGESIHRIWRRGDIVEFDSKDGSVVVPLVYDYLIWSEATSSRVAEATQLKDDFVPGASMTIWSAGDISPCAREALAEMGCAVRTNVHRDYPTFERTRKGLEGLKQRYDHRVEAPLVEELKEHLRPENDKRLQLAPLGTEVR